MRPDPFTVLVPKESKWRFGSFVLWEAQRRLEYRGQPVRLGGRAFDLLLQMLKRPGEVISNEEFLASVWSGVVVEEASVRVHMSLVRKALGKPGPEDGCREWIITIPLRGYCFVGPVHREAEVLLRQPQSILREPWPPLVVHVARLLAGVLPAGGQA